MAALQKHERGSQQHLLQQCLQVTTEPPICCHTPLRAIKLAVAHCFCALKYCCSDSVRRAKRCTQMTMLEALYRPHHPWELLTGSLDASVKRWNFSQGRSLRQWQMQPADEQSSSQVRLA